MRTFFPIFFALLSACGFGGGDGCVRVHQGDYQFPLKQVVKNSLQVRVSQAGLSGLTDQVHDLILTFFSADEDGHAIIPLSELGLGELSTEVGAFEGTIRDLVLTLDLAALSVDFVAGTTPPRMRVQVVDAEVGILSGEVAGAIGSGLFAGDVACGLENGSSGHTALLSFEILLDVAVDDSGTLQLEIASIEVDLKDVDLQVVVDCSISECLDGEQPPSTAQCSECEALCGTAGVVASLVGQLQGVLDQLVDQLLSALGAQFGNLLADQFFNGKPLAVEGTLSPADLFGDVLRYLNGKDAIGVLVRPAAGGFESIAAGDGVDVRFDAGFVALGVSSCASESGADPTFVAEAAPPFPAGASTADGAVIPYHFGFAMSAALANQAIWAAWRSGNLCIDVRSSEILALTQGKLDLRAKHLELLFPGLGAVVDPESRLRIRVQPDFSSEHPPALRFGDGALEPTLSMPLEGLRVAIDALVDGHPFQLLGLRVDARWELSLESLGGGLLGVRVDHVEVTAFEETHNDLFGNAKLGLIAEFALDLALQVVSSGLDAVEVDVGGALGGSLGPGTILEILQASDLSESEWLTVLLNVVDVPEEALPRPMVAVTLHTPGSVAVAWVDGHDEPVQLRVDGGAWGKVVHREGDFAHPRLWLTGPHTIEARVRRRSHPPGEAVIVAEVTVEQPKTAEHSPAIASPNGCASGPGPSAPWALLFALGIVLVCSRRSGRRARVFLVLLSGWLVGAACSDGRVSPEAPCTHQSQCLKNYTCSPAGRCVPATSCTDDAECCPGAHCFSGACRPTQVCEESCVGLDSQCRSGLCAPAECQSDAECSPLARCTAGVCLQGFPCSDACPTGEACHLDTGRCLAAISCPATCAAGSFRAISSDATPVDALACRSQTFSCECLPLPPAPKPMPGFEGRLVGLGDGSVAVVSYDTRYGDLVLSRFPVLGDSPVSRALDGVPAGPVRFSVEGYRSGIAAPGPNTGRQPRVVLHEAASGDALDILYRDEDLGNWRYLRVDLATDAVQQPMVLPIDGTAGPGACLVRDPGTGRLVGLVRVDRNLDGTHSQLVRVQALTLSPASPAEWSVDVIASRPLPAESDSPCGGTCSLTERCVKGPQGAFCASVLDAGNCTGTCPPHAFCVPAGPGDEACYPRIYFPGEVAAAGTGFFLSCVTRNEHVVAAWHDADSGALVASVGWPLAEQGQAVAGEGLSIRPGLQVSAALRDDGRVALAHGEEVGGGLYLSEEGSGGDWTTEILVPKRGWEEPSGWPHVAYVDASLVVLYHDGETGTAQLRVRDSEGCWSATGSLFDGSVTHPDLWARGDASVVVSARRVLFDADLRPMHSLQALDASLPACVDPVP